MGFLILIAFAMYGLGEMCNFPEGKRQNNTLDNRPESEGCHLNEKPEPDSRAGRPAPGRPSVRRGTSSGGMYRRAADEDNDESDGEVSIDELEYMRHFFH